MARGDWRLFVALPVPEGVANALDAQLDPLRHRYPAARWIPADFRHLTLVFLGWVAPAGVDDLVVAIDGIAGRHSAFRVELGGGGGRARPYEDGVAWLSLTAGGSEMSALAADLASVLPSPPLGGRPAGERPHMTLARRAPAALIRDVASLPATTSPLAWTAEAVVLFRSHLHPTGSRYEAIHAARLAGTVSA